MKSLPQPLSLSHLGLINLLKYFEVALYAKYGIRTSVWLQVSSSSKESSKPNSGDKLNPPPKMPTKTMVDPGDKSYLGGYWF